MESNSIWLPVAQAQIASTSTRSRKDMPWFTIHSCNLTARML